MSLALARLLGTIRLGFELGRHKDVNLWRVWYNELDTEVTSLLELHQGLHQVRDRLEN